MQWVSFSPELAEWEELAHGKQVGAPGTTGTSQVGKQRRKKCGITEWGPYRQLQTFVIGRAESLWRGMKAGKESGGLSRGAFAAQIGRWWEPPTFPNRTMTWSEPYSRRFLGQRCRK